jgi:hypothetical protein
VFDRSCGNLLRREDQTLIIRQHLASQIDMDGTLTKIRTKWLSDLKVVGDAK